MRRRSFLIAVVGVLLLQFARGSALARAHGTYRHADSTSPPYVYVAAGESVDAYPLDSLLGEQHGQRLVQLQPICGLLSSPFSPIEPDVAVDPAGYVVVMQGNDQITVFGGQSACPESELSTTDYMGTPIDVATTNAKTGPIYVANRGQNQQQGYISICTLPKGCGHQLRSGAIKGYAVAVAVDAQNNVYMAGYRDRSLSSGALVVFHNGAGKGTPIDVYQNVYPGGLAFDADGNLISFDNAEDTAWVYSGCPSACVAHGPFDLFGAGTHEYVPEYGKLTPDGRVLQVATYCTECASSVRLYAYSGTAGLTYAGGYNPLPVPGQDVNNISGLAIFPPVTP